MKTKLTNMLKKGKKEKKEGIDMQSLIEVDEEDSYTLKITARENEQ